MKNTKLTMLALSTLLVAAPLATASDAFIQQIAQTDGYERPFAASPQTRSNIVALRDAGKVDLAWAQAFAQSDGWQRDPILPRAVQTPLVPVRTAEKASALLAEVLRVRLAQSDGSPCENNSLC